MDSSAVAGPREGLELIDFVAVGIYLLVTGAIVVWSSRHQTTTEDYFLGGRRMPWMAVGLSLLATLMSSITYMGVPGEVISHGFTMFAGDLALPFSMFVVLVVWVPFFMRLKITSAYEYLERRFDYRVRLLGGLLFLWLRLGWMSMVMYVGSLAFTQMTVSLVPRNWPDPFVYWFDPATGATCLLRETLLYWVIGAIGLSATVYACAGGFRAAIWNDVLQSMMLLGGTFVTLGYVVWTTGTGPTEWWHIASQHTSGHTRLQWFSFDPTVRMTIVTAVMMSFFWAICTHGSDQVVLQRYFSTASLSAARRSYIVNAITGMTISALLALSGLSLLAFYLRHPTFLPEGILTEENGELVVKHGDRVLPHFFAHQLPAGIGGIVLAVLLCDAMQTLVSGVNSIGAVFSEDIFSRLYPNGSRLLSDLNLAKVLSVIVGLVVTGMGIGVAWLAQHSDRNIIDMMAPAFNVFLGPLAALFLIGMFLKCSARIAIVAALCGLLISIIWSYWKELFGTSYQPSVTLTTAVPYLASYLIAAVLGRLEKINPEDPALAYTWLSVMRRADNVESGMGNATTP